VLCKEMVDGGTAFCAQHRAANSARSGGHGATLEDRQAMHVAQRGLCAWCDLPVRLWDHVDHDHSTGLVRGIVHPRCNALVDVAESRPRVAAPGKVLGRPKGSGLKPGLRYPCGKLKPQGLR
jgi:hypothetical protein